MKAHRFNNSNPAEFDSNCAICGGKARDYIHSIPANEYAHGGTSEKLSPMEDARRREKALADGLRRMAWNDGISFREPLQIDSNGEFFLAVSNGTARDGKDDPCGEFGERIAKLLSKSDGARCGLAPTKFIHAKQGWCRLNHFAAQSILQEAAP